MSKLTYWYLILLITIFLLMKGCQGHKSPTQIVDDADEVDTLEIDLEYQPFIELCTWYGNKKAAYTIGFDDATSSHYLISEPELKQRGMVGTFNLNTRNILNWIPWQKVFDNGSEIASHTWSHVRCTELTEVSLRTELANAKNNIIHHIRGASDVPSFTYPYGAFNDTVRKIVMEYHSSARGGNGINNATLTEWEFSAVKGIGVYSPYDHNEINKYVLQAIQQKGWVLVYFHSVSEPDVTADNATPYSFFTEHLDFITSLVDSLWIATQGQVVDYIRNRQAAKISCEVIDSTIIEVSITDSLKNYPRKPKLTFALNIPSSWLNGTIIIQNFDSKMEKKIPAIDKSLLFEISPGTKLSIYAVIEKQVTVQPLLKIL